MYSTTLPLRNSRVDAPRAVQVRLPFSLGLEALMTEPTQQRTTTHAPCSSCGGVEGDFAPSGRHITCEAAVDIPTAVDSEPLMQIGAVAQRVTLSLRNRADLH